MNLLRTTASTGGWVRRSVAVMRYGWYEHLSLPIQGCVPSYFGHRGSDLYENYSIPCDLEIDSPHSALIWLLTTVNSYDASGKLSMPTG